MKKFIQIAAVLAALVLVLPFFTSCDNGDGEEPPTYTGVTQSEWENAFTFDGYSSKVKVDVSGVNVSGKKLIINDGDFKLQTYGTDENYAKIGNKFYCYTSGEGFHEVTSGEWPSGLPTTAKEMFDYVLKEINFASLKDKYNDFVFDSDYDNYSKTYSEYEVGKDKVTNLTIVVMFKGDGFFDLKDQNILINLNSAESSNKQIGMVVSIVDSTTAPENDFDINLD